MSIVKNFTGFLKQQEKRRSIPKHTRIEDSIEKVMRQNMMLRKQNAKLKHQIGIIRIQSKIQMIKLEKVIQQYKRMLQNQIQQFSQISLEAYGTSFQSQENNLNTQKQKPFIFKNQQNSRFILRAQDQKCCIAGNGVDRKGRQIVTQQVQRVSNPQMQICVKKSNKKQKDFYKEYQNFKITSLVNSQYKNSSLIHQIEHFENQEAFKPGQKQFA